MHIHLPDIESLLPYGEATPLLITLLMGVLAATNPCPLATNLSAILYISKNDPEGKHLLHSSLLFGLGRLVAYMLLGSISVLLLNWGIKVLNLSNEFFVYGDYVSGGFLILIGLFFLWGRKLHLPHLHLKEKTTDRLMGKGEKKRGWRALLLGMALALIFCPVTAIIFFGVMVPIAEEHTGGILYFFLFSLISVLPILLIYSILALGKKGAAKFYNRLQSVQKYLNIVAGIIFLVIGCYIALIHPLMHTH